MGHPLRTGKSLPSKPKGDLVVPIQVGLGEGDVVPVPRWLCWIW